MKKLVLFYSLTLLMATPIVTADGGALGVQFGDVTFGLGGSSKGPIIGVGPSPNDGSFSAVIVPGSECSKCNEHCNRCSEHRYHRHHRNHCDSCHGHHHGHYVEEVVVVE